MAERPGIVFYFDLLEVLEDFTTEEIGRLFLAAMHYGSTGEIAEFEDRAMKSVWRQMMLNVDRDQARFEKNILQRRYSGWISAQKRKGIREEDLPSKDEWVAAGCPSTFVYDSLQPSTAVDEGQQNQPTTTTPSTSTTPAATTTTTSSPSTSPKEEEDCSREKIEGSGGKEKPAPTAKPYIRPSEEQWEKMREEALAKLTDKGGTS